MQNRYAAMFFKVIFKQDRHGIWISTEKAGLGGPFDTISASLYYLIGLTQEIYRPEKFDSLFAAVFNDDYDILVGVLETDGNMQIIVQPEKKTSSLTAVTDFQNYPIDMSGVMKTKKE